MKLIYLDTPIWNIFARDEANFSEIENFLRDRDTSLSIGNFNRVELEQTYLREKTLDLFGKLLLALHQAQTVSVYLKDPIETIVNEMWTVKYGGQVEFSYDSRDRDAHLKEIEKRVQEGLTSDQSDMLRNRRIQNDSERLKIEDTLIMNPILKQTLKTVTPDSLYDWLNGEAKSLHGVKVWADIMQGRFPDIKRHELEEYARVLLESPVGLMSRTIVRANTYVFWRYARSENLPTRSLFDDTYHVASAAYCDGYLTCDAGQEAYLHLILPRTCASEVVDRNRSVKDIIATAERVVHA